MEIENKDCEDCRVWQNLDCMTRDGGISPDYSTTDDPFKSINYIKGRGCEGKQWPLYLGR